MTNDTKIMHAPGDCPDTGYGADCDGVGHFVPNPFASEIYDDVTPGWYCDGVLIGLAQDI
ncbi:hypothetical protein KPL76_06260 [Subtercola sp. PAMC28395]|uniref:hypothetical protein n=1 Tax=Subtercola sp. PAMC28395 TaxID=2846775 RepID=UPI001C0B77F2|nr:hypothetical protein [Subtercola sp. PAMC28395]QWT24957.1 hypothetical protein KPL76_06260 [Subtercola sp. PAMC28395]